MLHGVVFAGLFSPYFKGFFNILLVFLQNTKNYTRQNYRAHNIPRSPFDFLYQMLKKSQIGKEDLALKKIKNHKQFFSN